uniref:Receptor ligand binding region domain-containing protein n=1 Tax=Biomphalaria glabrata TaxID=6526 RepID=A0A2C9L0Y7_BIOGL
MHPLYVALICLLLLLAFTAFVEAQGRPRRRFPVRFAVILPSEYNNPEFKTLPFSLEKVLPALNLSLERIRKYLPQAEFVLNAEDSRCVYYIGPLKYVYMYMDGKVDVFMGPVYMYSLAQAARYSAHFKVPSLSVTGYQERFLLQRKVEFYTLTTVTGNYGKLTYFFDAIFTRFRFKNMGIIFQEATKTNLKCAGEVNVDQCLQIMFPLFRHFRNKNFTKMTQYSRILKNSSMSDYEMVLKKRERDSRIIVLCASPDSVRDIMIKAHDLNFDNGEYVFFNIDLFSR